MKRREGMFWLWHRADFAQKAVQRHEGPNADQVDAVWMPYQIMQVMIEWGWFKRRPSPLVTATISSPNIPAEPLQVEGVVHHHGKFNLTLRAPDRRLRMPSIADCAEIVSPSIPPEGYSGVVRFQWPDGTQWVLTATGGARVRIRPAQDGDRTPPITMGEGESCI